jgi:hypothetical protein
VAEWTIGSEVGQLDAVLLHRPGLELHRITPANMDELLFDELLWVDHAGEEHDAFAGLLRDQGVEVLYLEDLLAEVLADPGLRAIVIARHASDRTCAAICGPAGTGIPGGPGRSGPGGAPDRWRVRRRRRPRTGPRDRRCAARRDAAGPAAEHGVHAGLVRVDRVGCRAVSDAPPGAPPRVRPAAAGGDAPSSVRWVAGLVRPGRHRTLPRNLRGWRPPGRRGAGPGHRHLRTHDRGRRGGAGPPPCSLPAWSTGSWPSTAEGPRRDAPRHHRHPGGRRRLRDLPVR